MAVIMGNLAAERQICRITRHGYPAVPIRTDRLTAHHVREALPQLDIGRLDLLIIETDSNAHNRVDLDLGHHQRACVFSAAGGDEKATEYPFIVAACDLILLTKTDLLPYVTFDIQAFRQDVERLKPGLNIIYASAQRNQGIEAWVAWVESHLSSKVQDRMNTRIFNPFVSWGDRAKS